MRRVPCVIYHGQTGDEHVFHGTELRARRNALILGANRATFHWHFVPGLLDRLRAGLSKEEL